MKLMCMDSPEQIIAVNKGRAVTRGNFMYRAMKLAGQIPDRPVLLQCNEPIHGALAFCAAVIRGQSIIAPHPGMRGQDCYPLDDNKIEDLSYSPDKSHNFPFVPDINENRIAVTGYTSGSTSKHHTAHAKTLIQLYKAVESHAKVINRFAKSPNIIQCSMPIQHLFGFITVCVLPLITDNIMDNTVSFFPADLQDTLTPDHILAITTPHLEAAIKAGLKYGCKAVFVGGGAVSKELAIKAEEAFGCKMIELLGATEVLGYGARRTSRRADFTIYPGLSLESTDNGTLVAGNGINENTIVPDHLTIYTNNTFAYKSRASDLIRVSGKRESLSHIEGLITAVPGVDAVAVCQVGDGRLAAVIQGSESARRAIQEAVRTGAGDVFVPRPMRFVERLPRDTRGKVRRAAVATLLGLTT